MPTILDPQSASARPYSAYATAESSVRLLAFLPPTREAANESRLAATVNQCSSEIAQSHAHQRHDHGLFLELTGYVLRGISP
jgi:branched-subunit amino acid aminotransferase/4-amino-4-deoxychorismate lyase